MWAKGESADGKTGVPQGSQTPQAQKAEAEATAAGLKARRYKREGGASFARAGKVEVPLGLLPLVVSSMRNLFRHGNALLIPVLRQSRRFAPSEYADRAGLIGLIEVLYDGCAYKQK